jgi:hypothetical protein
MMLDQRQQEYLMHVPAHSSGIFAGGHSLSTSGITAEVMYMCIHVDSQHVVYAPPCACYIMPLYVIYTMKNLEPEQACPS